jgi:hypothetical protein
VGIEHREIKVASPPGLLPDYYKKRKREDCEIEEKMER